jgi:hypothetical protein
MAASGQIMRAMLFSAATLTGNIAHAQANILINGSFETPVIAPPYLDIGVGGEPTGFGWTVTTNTVDINRQGQFGWTAPEFDGVQSLDLVGFGSTGGIRQTFATTLGQQYNLLFAYANNPGPGVPTPASANVTIISGTSTLLSQSFSHGTSTTSNLAWTTFNMNFTAAGTSAVLAFNETLGGGDGGIFLDAISITPVPEPTSLALGATGLTTIWLMRRRKSKNSSI